MAPRMQGIPTNLSVQQFDGFVLPQLTDGRRGPHVRLTLHNISNYILLQFSRVRQSSQGICRRLQRQRVTVSVVTTADGERPQNLHAFLGDASILCM
jgi:hypothetical protein